QMNFGSGLLSGVDSTLDSGIAVEVDGACRADRRHAAGEIQLREGVLRRDLGPRTRCFDLIEEMVMHTDETRDHRAPVQIEYRRARWYADGSGVAQAGDTAVLDDHRLIILARAPGAIDHADVRQCHD